MTLNGTWKLYYCPQGSCRIDSVTELAGAEMDSVPCTVPGNVELGLSAAGVLPKDLFWGENILLAEKYETYEWWYETAFDAPKAPDAEHKMILHFGAVDCYADYYLNGKKIGESDNMFIAQEFDVTHLLRHGEKNTLHVHIESALIRSTASDIEPNVAAFTWHVTTPSVNARKAPHSYGWDIMPRAISAGIWRDVALICAEKYDFRYLYFNLDSLKNEGKTGEVRMMFDADLKPEHLFAPLTYVIRGRCGDSVFEHQCTYKGGAGRIIFDVDDIRLWWPKHYGEPNLYEISVEVFSGAGEKILSKTVRRGFRTLKLDRSDIIEKDGRFRFVINGENIMAIGSNWVPMDVYHSRDKARYAKALAMADDIGCNILRCWGGNVYEDQAFFDFCDEHGIMVWQDFAMACHYYPQTNTFFEKLEKEAEWVVKNLRDHPSLILWSGDNEIDDMTTRLGYDPGKNHITREVLPRVLERLDPFRPYIASSPYLSPQAYQLGRDYYPENHLWGMRDFHKSRFYTDSKAYFVSETGYHGCPAKKSIEKFIAPQYLWPYFDNRQWNLHSTDQNNKDDRIMLMHKQVQQMFGEVPTDMDEYVTASQICQAEAKKFFIERVRAKMSYMGGVIWWNLVDGWPQMSDAVVDYYYEKKLAYDYIRRSSRDFIIMMGEMDIWGHDVLCANSSLKEVSGTCTVMDMDSREIVFEKEFCAAPNANTNLGRLNVMYSQQGMFLIRWKLEDGQEHFNTYLYGTPAYSLKQYQGWLAALPKEKGD
ncbi:MAG: hypothetical protein IJ390_05740 [Lachnospiraceae bacterium]|nr:hypothetical protein [Lachnospiraceae bacterium]